MNSQINRVLTVPAIGNPRRHVIELDVKHPFEFLIKTDIYHLTDLDCHYDDDLRSGTEGPTKLVVPRGE